MAPAPHSEASSGTFSLRPWQTVFPEQKCGHLVVTLPEPQGFCGFSGSVLALVPRIAVFPYLFGSSSGGGLDGVSAPRRGFFRFWFGLVSAALRGCAEKLPDAVLWVRGGVRRRTRQPALLHRSLSFL